MDLQNQDPVDPKFVLILYLKKVKRERKVKEQAIRDFECVIEFSSIGMFWL